MLLSVVIPVYNVSEYLEECIESIINQTIKDMEIILINDCSPDENDEVICLNYQKQDPRIKYIKHETNKGISETRNHGIREAKGKYIYFIDSDDFLNDNNILYKSVNILEDNKNINFVGFGINNYINKKVEPYLFIKKDLEYITESKIDISYPISSISIWNKVFRRNDLIDNNIYFQPMVFSEDFMFHIEYFYKINPVYKYLNENVYMYRYRENSAVKNISIDKNVEVYFKSQLKLLEYIESINLIKKMKNYLNDMLLEYIIFNYSYQYIENNNSICNDLYLKIYSYYEIDYDRLNKFIYSNKNKYKIIVNNKEKFQKLFPKYKVRSEFWFRIRRKLYYMFKGIL